MSFHAVQKINNLCIKKLFYSISMWPSTINNSLLLKNKKKLEKINSRLFKKKKLEKNKLICSSNFLGQIDYQHFNNEQEG